MFEWVAGREVEGGSKENAFCSMRDIGAAIGLEIESGTKKQVTGIEGSRPDVYLHNISLCIPAQDRGRIYSGTSRCWSARYGWLLRAFQSDV
jgi:hypothetical protein